MKILGGIFLLLLIINLGVDIMNRIDKTQINIPINLDCNIINKTLINIAEGAKHKTCIYDDIVTKIYKGSKYVKYKYTKNYLFPIFDQKDADKLLMKYFNNLSTILVPIRNEENIWIYKNYKNIEYTNLINGMEKIDKIAIEKNLILDDLVLNRNVLVSNNSKGLIIDGNDINKLIKYDLFWIPFNILGFNNVARSDGLIVEFCSFKAFLNNSHNLYRCLNFCGKEFKLYPFKNLYGDKEMAKYIYKLKYPKNKYIYYEINHYINSYFIVLLILIIINIKIIKVFIKYILYNKKFKYKKFYRNNYNR